MNDKFQEFAAEAEEIFRIYGFKVSCAGQGIVYMYDDNGIQFDMNMSDVCEFYYPIGKGFRLSSGRRQFSSKYEFERCLNLFREEVKKYKEAMNGSNH